MSDLPPLDLALLGEGMYLGRREDGAGWRAAQDRAPSLRILDEEGEIRVAARDRREAQRQAGALHVRRIPGLDTIVSDALDRRPGPLPLPVLYHAASSRRLCFIGRAV